MTLSRTGNKYSPSAMGTYSDCAARFWHERHDDGTGELPTDPVPAAVGSAVHDALMNAHRQLEGLWLAASMPSEADAEKLLRMEILKALRVKQLDPSEPMVASRLKKLDAGISLVVPEMFADLPRWAVEPETGLLVWSEAWLDHGPGVRAVELAPGYLATTRPDIIGIRRLNADHYRVVVKDYKARREPVNPAFDDGIIVRAIWALSEVRNPRCEWFLAGRGIIVDETTIDVETVNLMHGGTTDFVIRHTFSGASIDARSDRLVGLMDEMALVDDLPDSSQVLATPSALCKEWCPVLHRCATGRMHVRKYAGEEALEVRLAELP